MLGYKEWMVRVADIIWLANDPSLLEFLQLNFKILPLLICGLTLLVAPSILRRCAGEAVHPGLSPRWRIENHIQNAVA